MFLRGAFLWVALAAAAVSAGDATMRFAGANMTRVAGAHVPVERIECERIGALGGAAAFECAAFPPAAVLTQVHLRRDGAQWHVFYAAEQLSQDDVAGGAVRAVARRAIEFRDDAWIHFALMYLTVIISVHTGVISVLPIYELFGFLIHGPSRSKELATSQQSAAKDRALAETEARELFPFLWLDSPLELDDARAQWRVVMDAHRVGPKTRLWPAVLDCARAKIGAIATDA